MKRAKLLGKTVLSLLLVFCLCACVSSELELTPEESHAFCEKYAKETAWIKTASSGWGIISPFTPLERIAASSARYSIPLCLFEVISVEPFDSESSAGRYWLHMSIQEVPSGSLSVIGQERVGSIGLKSAEEAACLIGKRYIGYLSQDGDLSFFNPYWTFLVTDDNRLVGGYGCQLEESQIDQMTEYNFSLESRSYTGQTLDYFIGRVREAEANVQTESQENSSQ